MPLLLSGEISLVPPVLVFLFLPFLSWSPFDLKSICRHHRTLCPFYYSGLLLRVDFFFFFRTSSLLLSQVFVTSFLQFLLSFFSLPEIVVEMYACLRSECDRLCILMTVTEETKRDTERSLFLVSLFTVSSLW